jgi:hypothetical protein
LWEISVLGGAIRGGSLECVRLLLSNWIEANADYVDLAASCGQVDIMRMLLESVRVTDLSQPLKEAVEGHHLDCARHLLSCGAGLTNRWGGLVLIELEGASPELRELLLTSCAIEEVDPLLARQKKEVRIELLYQAVSLGRVTARVFVGQVTSSVAFASDLIAYARKREDSAGFWSEHAKLKAEVDVREAARRWVDRVRAAGKRAPRPDVTAGRLGSLATLIGEDWSSVGGDMFDGWEQAKTEVVRALLQKLGVQVSRA